MDENKDNKTRKKMWEKTKEMQKKKKKKKEKEEYCLNKEICWKSREALDFVGWTAFKSLSLLKRNAKKEKRKKNSARIKKYIKTARKHWIS